MSGCTAVKVTELPNCDVCTYAGGRNEPAHYYAAVPQFNSCWALLCEKHFQQYQPTLGEGRGQRLIAESE